MYRSRPEPHTQVSTVIPMWKRWLDKMRERCPTFMPLVVSPLVGTEGTYLLIGGEKVPWEEYRRHVGVPANIEDRYPPR